MTELVLRDVRFPVSAKPGTLVLITGFVLNQGDRGVGFIRIRDFLTGEELGFTTVVTEANELFSWESFQVVPREGGLQILIEVGHEAF